MPSNIPATTIRIDPEVKKEATAILDELGLVHVHRRQRVPQGARPGGRDAVRDEGQDAGARWGDGRVSRQVGMSILV